jgi:septal ring factor EnvC (AmiA/AmiB activator)
MGNFDLIIGFGLIGIVIIVFLLYRMSILPKKSIPYVFGALAAIFGIAMFRRMRINGLKKELEERENKLKDQEARLQELKKNYQATEESLAKAKDELERQKAAYKKTMLQIDAEKRERLEEIETLSGDELDDAFDELLGRL